MHLPQNKMKRITQIWRQNKQTSFGANAHVSATKTREDTGQQIDTTINRVVCTKTCSLILAQNLFYLEPGILLMRRTDRVEATTSMLVLDPIT